MMFTALAVVKTWHQVEFTEINRDNVFWVRGLESVACCFVTRPRPSKQFAKTKDATANPGLTWILYPTRLGCIS